MGLDPIKIMLQFQFLEYWIVRYYLTKLSPLRMDSGFICIMTQGGHPSSVEETILITKRTSEYETYF